MEKILKLEGVKGVWFIEGGNVDEKLVLSLDSETSKRFKKLLSRFFLLSQEKDITGEIGIVFRHDYLLFKSVNRNWFLVWLKKKTSLAITRMEIEVILSEAIKKRSFLKKLKFW